MKRFGLIVVLFFFSAACEKTEKGFESNTLFDPVVKQIEIAGIEHNEGLAFVYDMLSTRIGSKENPGLSNEKMLKLSKEYTREFFVQNEVDFISENNTEVIDHAYEAYEKTKMLLSKKSDDAFSFFDFFETESLSDIPIELLSELDAAVNSEGSDLEELLAVFEVVRTRAYDECEVEEKYIVLAAIEIGINSMSYWYENLDYWVDLLGDGSKSWFNWRKVGAYDIGGAIGGAIVTAITGPGIAAGIVGGAVGASVTCAVVEVIGHYVDLD